MAYEITRTGSDFYGIAEDTYREMVDRSRKSSMSALGDYSGKSPFAEYMKKMPSGSMVDNHAYL